MKVEPGADASPGPDRQIERDKARTKRDQTTRPPGFKLLPRDVREPRCWRAKREVTGRDRTAGRIGERDTRAHGAASLGNPETGRRQGVPIQDPEVLDRYDLAVFRASPQTVNQTRWVNRELSLLDPVRTIGHPNSADVLQGRIGRMAFDESVVTSHPADRRFPLLSKLPRIYLVSFRCPVGLSGSPLWAHPLFAVARVIVGNIAIRSPGLPIRGDSYRGGQGHPAHPARGRVFRGRDSRARRSSHSSQDSAAVRYVNG